MSTVNQSLHGVLTRGFDRPTLGALGLASTVIVAVLGLAASVRAYRARSEIWGLCSAAVTGLLISPISWSHHWVWCIPIAVLAVGLVQAAESVGQAALALPFLVFYAYGSVSAPVTHDQDPDLSVLQQFAGALYSLFGAAFLALAASRYVRPGRDPSAAVLASRRGDGDLALEVVGRDDEQVTAQRARPFQEPA